MRQRQARKNIDMIAMAETDNMTTQLTLPRECQKLLNSMFLKAKNKKNPENPKDKTILIAYAIDDQNSIFMPLTVFRVTRR